MRKAIAGAVAAAAAIALGLLGFWFVGGQESAGAHDNVRFDVDQAYAAGPPADPPLYIHVSPKELPWGKTKKIYVAVRNDGTNVVSYVTIRDINGTVFSGWIYVYPASFYVTCPNHDYNISIDARAGQDSAHQNVPCKKKPETASMQIRPKIQLGPGPCGQGFPDSFVGAFTIGDVLSFTDTNTLPDGTVVTIGMEALQELSGSGEFSLLRDEAGDPVAYLFELIQLNQVLSPFPASGPDTTLSSSLAPGASAGGVMVLSDSDGDTVVDEGELAGDFQSLVTVVARPPMCQGTACEDTLFEGVLSSSVTGTWDFSCPDQTLSLDAFEDMPVPGVGGITELLVGSSDPPASRGPGSGPSMPYAAVAGAAAAAAVAIAAGGWYARRRWLG